LNHAQSGLEAARREQQANEHRLVELSDLIVAKDTETAARAQAVIDVKQLAERQGRLKTQIRQLEEERVLRQRDLDDYLFAMNAPR
jgi:predicted  nucleic acid-binding Zn-ribbon protein